MTREEAEHAVLSYLAERPRYHAHRLEIGAAIWEQTGGTFAASVIGSLLQRKLVSRGVPDRGPRYERYAITEAGRNALALEDEMQRSA